MGLVDVTSIPKSLCSFRPKKKRFDISHTPFSRSQIFIPMARSYRVSKLLPGISFLRSSEGATDKAQFPSTS